MPSKGFNERGWTTQQLQAALDDRKQQLNDILAIVQCDVLDKEGQPIVQDVSMYKFAFEKWCTLPDEIRDLEAILAVQDEDVLRKQISELTYERDILRSELSNARAALAARGVPDV